MYIVILIQVQFVKLHNDVYEIVSNNSILMYGILRNG